ncbi:hypothetical protein [Janibacter alittae]|uniref:Uncharacterized protein n=1 Tax=Janibacter alittae TaxID=3115209 RepID=A0ABZ2MIA9_9MICO
MVARQKVAVGRQYVQATATIHVSETNLAILLPDGDTKVVRRTNEQAVRSIKGQRPQTADTPIS